MFNYMLIQKFVIKYFYKFHQIIIIMTLQLIHLKWLNLINIMKRKIFLLINNYPFYMIFIILMLLLR